MWTAPLTIRMSYSEWLSRIISQWISDSTHIQGHTLDLVLSYGLDVTDFVLSDFLISDHKPILFSLTLPDLSHFSTTPVILSRFYSPQFSTNFNLCFAECCSQLHLNQPLSDLDADQHLGLMNSAWLKVATLTLTVSPIMSSASAIFDAFEPINLQELKEVIGKLKPSFCSSDFIHPRFLKLTINSIGPRLVSLINKCLQTGSVPANLKIATVTPLLKKPSLDSSVLNIFRPKIFFVFCQVIVFMRFFNLVLNLLTALSLPFESVK